MCEACGVVLDRYLYSTAEPITRSHARRHRHASTNFANSAAHLRLSHENQAKDASTFVEKRSDRLPYNSPQRRLANGAKDRLRCGSATAHQTDWRQGSRLVQLRFAFDLAEAPAESTASTEMNTCARTRLGIADDPQFQADETQTSEFVHYVTPPLATRGHQLQTANTAERVWSPDMCDRLKPRSTVQSAEGHLPRSTKRHRAKPKQSRNEEQMRHSQRRPKSYPVCCTSPQAL